MRRRFFWLVVGWALGMSTSVWTRRRLRRTVERYTPEHLRRELAERSSAVADQGADLLRRVRQIRAGTGHEHDNLHADHDSRRRHRPVRPVT